VLGISLDHCPKIAALGSLALKKTVFLPGQRIWLEKNG
jgi:hypothetical protein